MNAMTQPPKNNRQKPDLQLKNNHMKPLMEALGDRSGMGPKMRKPSLKNTLGERKEKGEKYV